MSAMELSLMTAGKISYSPYGLKSKGIQGGLSSAYGVLLRIENSQGANGFCDLHPHPELGDFSLEIQLKKLAQGLLTPLTRNSLWLAEKDMQARVQRKSLFRFPIPLSHLSLGRWWIGQPSEFLENKIGRQIVDYGFKVVKVKVSNHDGEIKKLVSLIKSLSGCDLKWRIDCNNIWNESVWNNWIQSLPPDLFDKIEFIEDPLPYNSSLWRKLNSHLPLALDERQTKIDLIGIGSGPESTSPDCIYDDVSFSYLVVKPAVDNLESLTAWLIKRMALNKKQDPKVVMTSSMDHPVGQLGAAWVASEWHHGLGQNINFSLQSCGLVTQDLFEPNEFSEQMIQQGPKLFPPAGTGIGFDQLLEQQKWIPL